MQRRVVTVAVAVLAMGAAVLSQVSTPDGVQAPTPTFKAEVEYVEVDALVTDDSGQFVRGLQADDFRVFEDGKPQTIASFALVDVPSVARQPLLVDGVPVETDVQSTETPFTGRLYVLILDSLHTAPERTPLVRAVARRFIDRYLRANDLMAVVQTDGRATASQDFTGNPRLLRAAVDAFMGQKLESATLARNNEFIRGSSTGDNIADPVDAERGMNARSSLRAISQVADWLAGVRGRRKTILLISEGIDYDITDVFNNRSASSVIDETRDAIAAASRANVSIYAIDPGSAIGAADAIEVGSFADQVVSMAPTNDDGTVERAPGINSRGLDNERRLAQDSLRTLADETSGYAAVAGTSVAAAFERVVGDSSAYYVLAYYPGSARRDGKFHRIEVRPSRPGLKVRARKGYMAPRDSRRTPRAAGGREGSPPLSEALNSPLPAGGVGMRVFAAPFKGTAPNASVVLATELRGRDLAFAPGRVEVSYAAVDASGRVRATDTDSFSLTLPPETKARVQERGLRLLKRFDLPPGRYQIRVAARNAVSGALGVLSYDLDVADFHKLPFSMSGVLLTSATGASTITARPDEQLRAVMPSPPVSLRRFPQQDEVLAFTEIYDRAGTARHTVDIVTSVRSPDGSVHFQDAQERSSDELQGPSAAYRYIARVPMNKLTPGRYVLTVEARSRLGQSASRHIPFDVAP